MTHKKDTLKIYCDGGARSNPGPAAIGALVYDHSNTLLHQISQKIGFATNNIAEYKAVETVLKWLKNYLHKNPNMKVENIYLYLDSLLVVNQLTGKYKIKNKKLQQIAISIFQTTSQLKTPISYFHIPRSQNAQADKLVNNALDKT